VAQKTKSRQGMKPFYLILGGIAVVGIAAIAWVVMRNKTSDVAISPVEVPGADNPQALVEKAKGVSVGSDAAPVKMLVFSDYQCPYCAEFASMIEPAIVKEFVPTGKLQFVYYDYPLGGAHKYSFLAARAARCAGEQNKFWEYHDMVFGKQSEWAAEEGMPLKTLLGYGNDLGLDAGAFKSCVDSDKYQDIVSANHLLGEKLGVNATPTIFVNGRRISGQTMDDLTKNLRSTIASEAGAAAPAPAAPATTTAQ
jgi:protein-disulfide isomerase